MQQRVNEWQSDEGAGRGNLAAFEELGATRIHPLVQCDVDYETLVPEWTTGVFTALENASAPA